MSEYPNWKEFDSYEKREKNVDWDLWRSLREERLEHIKEIISDVLYKPSKVDEKLESLKEVKDELWFWRVHQWSSISRYFDQALSNIQYLEQQLSLSLEVMR